MKKVSLLFFGLLTSLTLAISPALAASPEDVLTENTSLYVKIDPSTLSSNTMTYYTDFLEMIFLDEFIYSYDLTEAQAQQAEEMMGFLVDHLEDNAITIFMDDSKEDSTYFDPYIGMAVEITESQFIDEMEDAYLKDNSTEIIEQDGYHSYQGKGIDAAFTFLDGTLLITEDTDTASHFLTNYTGNCTGECLSALSETSSFTEAQNNFYSSSILDFYLSGTPGNSLFEEINEELYGTSTILSAINSESISFKKTSNGFDLKTFVDYDSNALSNLGINFENNRDLSLYKYMPSNKPIYFTDTVSSNASIETIKLMDDYQDFIDEVQTETEVNIETLLTAYEKEMALLIEDSNELLPTFTLLSDASENTTNIETEVDKLYNNIWTELTADADQVINVNTVEYQEDGIKYRFTKDTVKIKDATLKTIDLEVILSDSNNPYALELTSDLLRFTFTMGVTDDNILLVSTNKNISSDYGDDISSNSSINALIDENPTAIGYFSTDNLNAHIQRLLSTVEAGSSEHISDLELTKNFFNAIFSPFGEFTSTEHATNTSAISEVSMEMDLDELILNIEDIIETPQNYDPEIDDSIESIIDAQQDFPDVKKEDWFANDVYYLSTTDVVDGYDDGTYKPNNPINRAEFTKIIMESLENQNYLYNYFYDSAILETFSDIGEFEWYTPYLSTAYENNIISGYDDGTFKPDKSITRAETAQIITNIINKYEFEKPADSQDISPAQTFSDISGTEWYTAAVETVYEYKIMTGTTDTTFEPNRNINRAESAKVINNLIKLMEAQKTTTP